MGQKSKRFREIAKLHEKNRVYTLSEAIEILKQCPPVKFDQSVEIAIKTGVDPRKSDQNVRGTVLLPNGTGKTIKVLVLTKGEKIQEALDAGADFAGHDEYIEKINSGWTDFDAVVATPDMMRDVGKLGKILGPRGLMPTPKGGTVTTDVAKAVSDLKGGKIEFRVDKHAVINNLIAKLPFPTESILENCSAFLQAVVKAKPATAKGQYIKSITLSSTMGPGLKIDHRGIEF